MRPINVIMHAIFAVLFLVSPALSAGEAKPPVAKEDADPLAKFSEEKLADIGFCFDALCKAVAAKDARTAAAFIVDLPRPLAKLNFAKEGDRKQLLDALAKFEGASLKSSQRMAGGIAQVTYTDKKGAERTQRMRNAGGCWKLPDFDP